MRLMCTVMLFAVGASVSVVVPVKQCLAQNCATQIKACAADPTCDKGINCVIACNPLTTACVQKCIQSSMDETMLAVGVCAEAHHCIPVGSTR